MIVKKTQQQRQTTRTLLRNDKTAKRDRENKNGHEVTFLTSKEISLHEVKNRFGFGRRRRITLDKPPKWTPCHIYYIYVWNITNPNPKNRKWKIFKTLKRNQSKISSTARLSPYFFRCIAVLLLLLLLSDGCVSVSRSYGIPSHFTCIRILSIVLWGQKFWPGIFRV